MFAVTVQFEVHPQNFVSFLPLIAQNARASVEREPGCRQFDVLTDPDRPNQVFLYELYDDEAAFQAHTEQAHYAEFNAASDGMTASKKVTTFREVSQ